MRLLRKLISLLFLATLPLAAGAQVNAGFTIVYQNPDCAPAVVSFVNTSTGVGAITSSWNFGVNPGVNSILQSPSTTYSTCGTYTVKLIVTNGTQTDSVVHQVVVHCNPTASFSANPVSGCPPLNTQFTNTSTPGSGSITSYVWDFGDGSPANNSTSPSHLYQTTGCKNVTLIVTNNFGCTDHVTVNNIVCVNTPPVAAFTSNPSPAISCAAPFTVTFNGSGSSGNPPYSYNWAFAGGTPATSSAQNPVVVFNSTGYHAVQLIVTDASGCQDTLNLPQYVFIGNFSSLFSISSTTGCSPVTINVNASSSGAATYAWTAVGGTPATAASQAASFTYNTPGSYQICLTATSSGGCVSSNCTTVVVHATPVAAFTSVGNNPNACQAPMTVTYTNTSTGGTQANWTFSGGTPSTSTANVVTVVYHNCGNFNTTLIESNAGACADTITQTNYVNINCPVAAFSASPLGGCIPQTIQFNSSASQGSPVQWKWNFGTTGNPNAVQSTQANPSFTFSTPGCYDIRLVIINAAGCTDTALQAAMICVGTPPVASFTSTPPVACANVPIHFTNTSTSTFPYTTYHWFFGDGGTSNSKNPTYTYNDTGYFNVTLVVCNYGCCDTVTIDSVVRILPPIASISTVNDCINPGHYLFDGTHSIGADTYSWVFQSGTPPTSNASTQAVDFNASGNYNVTLTVTNNATGCSNSSTINIHVRHLQALFTMPSAACLPYTLNLVNNSIDATGSLWRYYNSSGVQLYQTNALNPAPYTFNATGTYTIWLRVADINGCLDTLTQTITIYNMIPGFTASPSNVCAPVTASFQDATNYLNSTASSWAWDFGDPGSGAANTSGLQNPTHYYQHSGNYTVTLTITDVHGCVYTITHNNIIQLNGPVADFISPNPVICPGTPVCFLNQSTGNGLTYHWNFGSPPASTQTNPCHTYAAGGNYSVQLVAVDNQGCRDTMIKPNFVHVVNVQANFTEDTTGTICPPLPVTFTNLSTGVDSITTYHWDFGDGSTSTTPNPYHIYNNPGLYTVTLIVNSGYGCSDTLVMPNLIGVGGPSGSVTSTPNSGCVPLTNCFHLTSSTPGLNITWNFGDGTVLLNAPDSACHVYVNAGTFYPQVILSNGLGCVVSIPITTIIASSPTASFTPSDTSLCNGGTVVFSNASSSSVPITSYHWNFGDPLSGNQDTSSLASPSHTFNHIGTFTVLLVITNSLGCTDSASQLIQVAQGPHALFTVLNTPVCPNVPVNFQNQSTPAGSIVSHHWNFGDPGSGPQNTDTSLNASHVFSNPGSYTVTLTIQTSGSCSDTVSHTVVVLSNPVAAIVPSVNPICVGDTVQLQGSGGLHYLWSPAAAVSNDTLSNPITIPAASTTFTLQVTDVHGCTDTAQLMVVVNPLPVLITSNDTFICLGHPILLSVSGASSYVWTPSATLTNANTATPTANPSSNITYYVTGTDVNGCKSRDSVQVAIIQNPLASAGPDVSFCRGDSAQLQASGGNHFLWVPALNLSSDTIPNPFVSATSTTWYDVVVTDQFGCSGHDSVLVTVHQWPPVHILPVSVLCKGDSVSLFATGALHYLWTPALYLSNDTLANPVCHAIDTMTYVVLGTDAFGCTNTDTIRVPVDQPFFSTATGDTAVCIGQEVQLHASGSYFFHWSPPNGLSNPNIADPMATPQTSTVYQVIISDHVCLQFNDTLYANVTVNPLPTVDAGPDFTILAGQQQAIQITHSPVSTYSWSPSATLSCAGCETPVASPDYSTTYTITVTDTNGCKAEDSMRITINCNDEVIYIPNAFTPNHDNKNDVFLIRSTGIKTLKYFRIFNRWGQLVFETNDLSQGWDGTFHGEEMAPAVFVYYIEATCSNDESIKIQGNVTLLR